MCIRDRHKRAHGASVDLARQIGRLAGVTGFDVLPFDLVAVRRRIPGSAGRGGYAEFHTSAHVLYSQILDKPMKYLPILAVLITSCNVSAPTTTVKLPPGKTDEQNARLLLTDAQVVAIAIKIGDDLRYNHDSFSYCHLKVTDDESTLGDMLNLLGLEVSLSENITISGVNNVTILTIRISPSYQLGMLTANNDERNHNLGFSNPKRIVYSPTVGLCPSN